jgi:hypothetical protein
MFLRAIISIITALLVLLAVPLVFRLFGFDLSSDLLMLIRICVAGTVVWYIFFGPASWPWTRVP